jgi:transcriptional regulator with XRE-family HTH domain
MTAAEKVLQLCEEKGIKISRLEKDLGFSNAYVKGLANGKGKIPTDRLTKIAGYLGVSRADIDPENFGEKDEKLFTLSEENPFAEIMQYLSGISREDLTALTAQAKRLYLYNRKMKELIERKDA